jgi:peptidoglycan/xylan/chitin deacetylase (PgdA/CDA1 family)
MIALHGLSPAPGIAQVVRTGPQHCQAVAITFDLCPVRQGAGYDPELIGLMKERKIPATFFMSGRWMTRHQDQVRDLLSIPFFELGTHGQAHAHLPLLDSARQRDEILTPVTMLKTRFGRGTTLFRPPYGEFDDMTVEVVKALGLQFILWNIESGDPDPTLTAEQIKDRLAHVIRRGSIIVMHANGKGQHTKEVVEYLMTDLLPKKGLQPMTVTELLTCRAPAPP